MNNDKLVIAGHEFDSRFILGSGKYNLNLIKASVEDAGAEIITLALRRVKIFCLAPFPFFFSGGMNYEQEL